MDYLRFTSIIYLTLGILILLLGILIFRENPTRRINRVTGMMMFLAALAPIMSAFSILIRKSSPELHIETSIFSRIYLIWEFFFPQLLLFSLIFPKENVLIKNHRGIAPLLYLPHFLQLFVILLFRSSDSILSLINFTHTRVNIILQPFFILINLLLTLLSYIYEYHNSIFALINLIYALLAIYIMHRGYTELTRASERKQIGIVLWGIRVSIGLYVINFLVPKIFPIQVSEKLNYALTFLALFIGPGSIALSIIKYQFLDVRLIIRRGIIFSLTSGLLIGIYLLLYSQAKNIFTAVFGIDIPFIEIFFLIMAIIFFQPILNSLEETVERIFGQDKPDYRHVLQSLSHDILHVIEMDQLREKIIQTLKDAMMLESVHLLLKNKDNHFVFNSHTERLSAKNEFIFLMSGLSDHITIDEVLGRIQNEDAFQAIHALNASLFFPISHHNTLQGVLCLGRKLTREKFSAEDLTSLRVLSDQIAIALENTELYKEKLEKQRIDEEISVTREIQKMLLPHEIPQGRNFEIAAMNISSKEVGGDYYDFFRIDERRVGIAIGDISGKGIPGAILMSNLQATFRAVVMNNPSTADTTFKINNQITRTTSAEKYATFFYGILDTKKLSFTYTNAGHNYPILKKKDGECFYLKESGLIIGVMEDYIYHENSIKLNIGDVLILYTDGITEAINKRQDEFSEGHLLNLVCATPVTSAENLRNIIYQEVVNFRQGSTQFDDITLIVVNLI